MVPWGNGGGRAEGVEERRGWKSGGGGRGEGVKFSFLGSGELRHLAGSPGGGGESAFVIL